MKNVLIKSLLIAFLSILSISVSNAYQCSCTMKNAKGQTWVGTGPTRAIAGMNAQKFCSKNSAKLVNCRNVGCVCR